MNNARRLARTNAPLLDLEGNVLVPAGTVGEILRVISQDNMMYPDLEVAFPNGVIEISPANTFDPVND